MSKISEESTLDQLLKARAQIDQQLLRHKATLTIMFTDVVGSTAYFDRYGDVEGMAMIHRHTELGSNAVVEHGGRVIKTIGDSVMAEFPDPVQGVRASIAIQRNLLQVNSTLSEHQRLQLRIGLNHGPCMRVGDDVSGDAVNVAARVCKKTGPAQILVSSSVKESLVEHDDLHCTLVGEVTLAGKGEKAEIYEVAWTDSRTYTGLREHVTLALKRGDIMAPGLKMEDLVPQPTVAEAPPTPLPSSIVPPTPPPSPVPLSEQPTADFKTPAMATMAARYELLGELGNGGMGVVYKARDRETGDLVALKVLRSEIAADAAGLNRFKNELRIARRITHKNICRIHEFNRSADAAYISMEFVEGQSLRGIIRAQSALPAEKALPIARQICAGLAEAHAQGVVHRDLKPENVMIDADGVVKVMDFGIARSSLSPGMTQTGAIVGTPAYMAPEQAEGTSLDQRADVYALGLILYEMFTGTQTFRAETPIAVVMKHLRDVPTPPRQFKANIPPHLERAILKCLAKKPAERFQSVEELAAALTDDPPAEAEIIPAAAIPEIPEPQFPTGQELPPAVRKQPAQTVRMPSVVAAPAPAPMPVAAAPARPGTSLAKVGAIAAVFLAMASVAGYFLWQRFRPSSTSAPQEQAQAQPQGTVPGQTQPPSGTTTVPLGQTATEQPPADTTPPGGAASPTSGGRVVELARDETSPTGGTAPRDAGARAGERSGASTPEARKAAPNSETSAPAAVRPLVLEFSPGRTLAGHTKGVSAVVFSLNGNYVATASEDRTVRVWEAGTGRLVNTMKGHTDVVTSVAFSPDGRNVVSGSRDKTIRIWETANGSEVQALPKDTGFILTVAFSPNGRFVAVGTSEGRVKILEAGSWTGLQSMEGHAGAVYSVVFSPDSRLVASAGLDQTARLWNVNSGQEVRALRGHGDSVSAVAFSPDGRLLASGSDDKTVKIWETSTGRKVRTLTGHTGGVEAVVFGSDGRWLASGGADKVVKVWEVATGREVSSLEGHIFAISDLAATRDGRWLASASGDSAVRLWRRSEQ